MDLVLHFLNRSVVLTEIEGRQLFSLGPLDPSNQQRVQPFQSNPCLASPTLDQGSLDEPPRNTVKDGPMNWNNPFFMQISTTKMYEHLADNTAESLHPQPEEQDGQGTMAQVWGLLLRLARLQRSECFQFLTEPTVLS